MNVINQWQEIPRFKTEEEEVRFWANTRLDVRLFADVVETALLLR